MNLGHKPLVWWELPLTTTWVDRELLPYLVGNSPYVTMYGHGIPHWSGSTIARLGNTVYTRSRITQTRLYQIIAYFEGHLPHQKSLH